ncbi:MAG: ACT domain-containing protein [Anaerolineales bacterium]|nr:ACT domain-containing protein [Anaerolineales bacterium]
MNDHSGETDLDYLIKNMQPILEDEELVFCSLSPARAEEYFVLCQGYYLEREGITVIIGKHLADLNDLAYDLVFKRITMNVHSSLAAVGFLARITEVLAAQGFSVNVVSAYYHDYLYIQSDLAQAALETLLLWRDKMSQED